MTKKRWLTSAALLAVLGAVFAVSQIVWASDDEGKKPESVQVSQMNHAAHHPESQAAGNATVNEKADPGSMQDMMKMMGNSGMNDMMKDDGMQDMMKMMETPEGKQMMEKCNELLQQQPENQSTVR